MISTRSTSSIVLPALLERLRAGLRRRAREARELVGDVALRDDRRERLEPAPRAHSSSRRPRRRRRRSRRARCRRWSCPPGRTPARAPRASRASCRAAAPRRRRPRRPRRSRRRSAPRRSPRPRAGASGSAHASCSSREMPSSRETNDACSTMCRPSKLEREAVVDHQVDRASRRRGGTRSAPGSAYGAFDIDSIPPVTTTSASPARIIESAISTARIEEAQTLLIVSDGTLDRHPGADRRLARGRLAGAGLQHLAHDHVLDLARLDAGALERGADRDRAELRRGIPGEAAVVCPSADDRHQLSCVS